LSITDEEFCSVIARSVAPEVVGPVIAEIRAKREKLKIKHVIVYFVCFSIIGLMVYCLFPSLRPPSVADAWDELNVNPESYETEKTLIDSLTTEGNASSLSTLTGKKKMSRERRTNALKYRTMNMVKNSSDYLAGHEKYIAVFHRLASQYEDIELKECYAEGVLKSFPWDESGVGLSCYAREIKNRGDPKYKDRERQIVLAKEWCDDMLNSLHNGKGNVKNNEKKMSCVKLQKAQLLMYRWLVANLEKSRDGKVKCFPDDRGDPGVNYREEAIKIINESLENTKEGRELYNQCVGVLIEDSSWGNVIFFDGEHYFWHKKLLDKRYK